MENNFANYEQALALKELGFDELCLKYWVGEIHENNILFVLDDEKLNDDELCAPLKQQVFRWFREKYSIDCYLTNKLQVVASYGYFVVIDNEWYPHLERDSYEEAVSVCIDRVIELVKQQDNGK